MDVKRHNASEMACDECPCSSITRGSVTSCGIVPLSYQHVFFKMLFDTGSPWYHDAFFSDHESVGWFDI